MKNSTQSSWRARTLSLSLGTVLIAGVSLAGATAAHAAPGDLFSVSGEVRDAAAAPLEGVEAGIYFTTEDSGSSYYTDVTAADGTFTIDGIPVGDHGVTFSLEGHGFEYVEFTIVDADVIIPPVTLLPYTDASGATATISGTGELGTPLTVTTTGWPAGTVFTYGWFAPTSAQSGDIADSDDATYVVTEEVIGRNVRVWVYGSVPGVSAPNDVASSNSVLAFAPKKPMAAAPADLAAYLLLHSSTPAAQTTAGLPAGPLNTGTAHTANLPWDAADSFVDVYIFSTPTAVGTFAVVNGVAQITLSTAVLSQLSTGNHTLVATGQTSGAVQSLSLAIGLAATGAESAVVPVTVASLLLLIGAALLVARRRVAQSV